MDRFHDLNGIGLRFSVCLLENNLTAEYSLVPPGRQWLDCRSFVGSQQWAAGRHTKGGMVALSDLKVHLWVLHKPLFGRLEYE